MYSADFCFFGHFILCDFREILEIVCKKRDWHLAHRIFKPSATLKISDDTFGSLRT